MVFILSFTASWPLPILPQSHCRAPVSQASLSTVPPSPALSTMSARHEHQTVDVPGVGEVPSAWIGQMGKRNIGKLVEREELRPVVKGLQQELRNLARTCSKALNKLNAEGMEDEDVAAALGLCKNF